VQEAAGSEELQVPLEGKGAAEAQPPEEVVEEGLVDQDVFPEDLRAHAHRPLHPLEGDVVQHEGVHAHQQPPEPGLPQLESLSLVVPSSVHQKELVSTKVEGRSISAALLTALSRSPKLRKGSPPVR
jgi:hypothetical protein